VDERCASCRFAPAQCCETRYSRKLLKTLLENGVVPDDEATWRDVPGWIELRAIVEKTGDVESEALATVIDIERALVALQSRHPDGALVVAAVMLLDFTPHDFVEAFGERRDGRWLRLQTKSTAFMAAWLAGLPLDSVDKDSPSCELAWKRAR